ncbi:MAG: hypothetical protein JO228_02975 [Xanthobacteraceae bacterium]|nr:hypothetical protein [Xanthobacteraceae bacterium]
MLVLVSLALASASAGSALAAAVPGAPLRPGDLATTEAVLRWVNGYRARRDLSHVPMAVHALSELGALRDPESSGVYVGFIAGIIGANPGKADELIGKILPLPPEDDWVLVRGIAYSGVPGWKDMLARLADRLPRRRLMIDKFLERKLATLDDVSFAAPPSTMDRVRNFMTFRKPPDAIKLDAGPEVLDALWGYYFASGSYGPISRILRMLTWSKERDDAERLTVGNMAKYTLASNAARDADLLAMLKQGLDRQPADIQPILKEVIEAAETMELAQIRKAALASIEDLKRKGPGYKRDISTWGQLGQGAVALGCIAAAAAGQVEIGIPCVVGGALSSAALNYWGKE